MTLGSVITETIFISDPHAGHKSGSTSKMRLRSRAQLAREGEEIGSGCGWGPASRAPTAARAPVLRHNPIRAARRPFPAVRARGPYPCGPKTSPTLDPASESAEIRNPRRRFYIRWFTTSRSPA